jgi:hypothetical protein
MLALFFQNMGVDKARSRHMRIHPPARNAAHSHRYSLVHAGLGYTVSNLILVREVPNPRLRSNAAIGHCHIAVSRTVMWRWFPDQAPIQQNQYSIFDTQMTTHQINESNPPISEYPEITLGEMTLPRPTVWMNLVSLCNSSHVEYSNLKCSLADLLATSLDGD